MQKNRKNIDMQDFLSEEMNNTQVKPIIGKRNIYHSMAGGIAARLLDLRKEVIRESLGEFTRAGHRLESVAKVRGIEFINDSAATNVNATWFSLESLTGPLIWIAGGRNKDEDFRPLIPVLNEKVDWIILLGNENQRLEHALAEFGGQVFHALSLDEAVQTAYHYASASQKVLFSPSCASFDMFSDYQERGLRFRQAVNQL